MCASNSKEPEIEETPCGPKLKATQIDIAQFSQIFYLPLVWQSGTPFDFEAQCKHLEKAQWQAVKSPFEKEGTLEDMRDEDTALYDEYVYFHDFLRDFLYPEGDKPICKTYHLPKAEGAEIKADFHNEAGKHSFIIKRLHWRLFRTSIAILCLELDCTCWPLNLAQVQTIIDHLRRIYPPFWHAPDKPQRVPAALEIPELSITMQPQNKQEALRKLVENRKRKADTELLEPWRSWTQPFGLCLDEPPSEQNNHDQQGYCNWRAPSDERMPCMSFIVLKANGTNKETILRVSDGDWCRLAEADQSGSANFEYSKPFLDKKQNAFFYDRFMPTFGQDDVPDYYGTRHVFGGAHYAFVTTTGSMQSTFSRHFRQHYEKMGLIIQFEFFTMLSFSSQIVRLVKNYEEEQDKKQFQNAILELQERFMNYTHRFHFTGVSNQIQGKEMYQKWRESLELDTLYEDVKEEIASAAAIANAQLEAGRSDNANTLAQAAMASGALFGSAALVEFEAFKWLTCTIETLTLLPKNAAELLALGFVFFIIYGLFTWFYHRRDHKKGQV